jgi:wyosine [tRNA(Phe)-imidazoG37] synthetase (radical SAM superfamily)
MGGYKDVIGVDEIMKVLSESLKVHQDIDALTITANGEPTLYPHLFELMERIESIKGSIKTLILSNGSTILDREVQKSLMKFDTVKLSLDCATSKCLKRLDRSHDGILVDDIKKGMLDFSDRFFKSLIIEVLIVKNINDRREEIEALNSFLLELNPTRIDIGTIDRPPAYRVEALSYEELREISLQFDSSLPVYIATRKKVIEKPSSYSSEEILSTLKKRPLTEDDTNVLFDDKSRDILKNLIKDKRVITINSSGYDFFVVYN